MGNKEGDLVGVFVGKFVGAFDGSRLGCALDKTVGDILGSKLVVGFVVGLSVLPKFSKSFENLILLELMRTPSPIDGSDWLYTVAFKIITLLDVRLCAQTLVNKIRKLNVICIPYCFIDIIVP